MAPNPENPTMPGDHRRHEDEVRRQGVSGPERHPGLGQAHPERGHGDPVATTGAHRRTRGGSQATTGRRPRSTRCPSAGSTTTAISSDASPARTSW